MIRLALGLAVALSVFACSMLDGQAGSARKNFTGPELIAITAPPVLSKR